MVAKRITKYLRDRWIRFAGAEIGVGLRHLLLWLAMPLLFSCGLDSADSENATRRAEVVLDPAIKFQTIEGFGGFGAQQVWWKPGPFFDQEFIELLIDDLGVTLLRDDVPLGLEPQNDNDDPFELNMAYFEQMLSASSLGDSPRQHFAYLQALHEKGLERIVASVWSPPPWMKYNNRSNNGSYRENSAPAYSLQPDATTNQLKPEYYQEFAEYCVAYIRLLKQTTGIDLYAISLQNEPRFSQYYPSNVHSPESLRDLIKVVGARFAQEGIKTKIFAPEDVASIRHIRRYLDAILNDPEANRYTAVFAIHNYKGDGVRPGEHAPKNWQETYRKAQEGGKTLWMSETAGFATSSMEEGGIALAKSMYNALYYGNVSAWIYWQMSESKDKGFIENGRPNILYQVAKQFYRHIRPGAVRVAAESSDEELLALAFAHPVSRTATLVLINIAGRPVAVTIRGERSEAAFVGYLTSENDHHRELGQLHLAERSLELPGQSVLTLVSVNDAPQNKSH